MPGAYIQFVRFKGETNGGTILNERRLEGCLYKMLPELEKFIDNAIVTKRPVPISTLREKDVRNYPYKALRELMMNAVMHRDYQSNMPTRLYQYDTHVEIMNPGGLYGQARPENFPHVNDYRNSAVAEMMRTLNYVNMFNHGVRDVQEQLRENESPMAEFNVNYLTVFSVIVREPQQEYYSPNIQQLVSSLSPQAKSLIMSINCTGMTASELQLVTNLSPKSKQLFRSQFIYPCIEAGLIEMSYPDNPRHPKQKYALTELGVKIKEVISENATI